MKPKSFLAPLAIAAILTTIPASADVAVKDVLFRHNGEDLNIRVVVRNRAATSQLGPVKITLFVRANGNAEWTQVKVWNDIEKINAGDSVARDIFAENAEILKNSTSNPNLEAKATVEAPGAQTDTMSVVNTGYK